MQWSDNAIILSSRKYGESSALVRLFSPQHGVSGGVVRSAASKTNRGIYQPGNHVIATWNARLAEQLGTFKCELAEATTAHLMHDGMRLNTLSAACALIESALPERHPYVRLYEVFQAFLVALRDTERWLEQYVRFELELLSESGFGLDLRACAATGGTQELVYVSPKSGRAVSRAAGAPYHDKMLKLPPFLLQVSPKALPLEGTGAPLQALPLKGTSAPLKALPLEGTSAPLKALPLEGGGLGGGGLTLRSRELRKNATEAEKKLWLSLSRQQLNNHRFRRQHPVGGLYIADFICLEQRLIIELDGGQHAERKEYDAKRTEFLESEGYRVLRFWNNEVLENMDGVWIKIKEALMTPPPNIEPPPPDIEPPPPNPPPSRGRALSGEHVPAREEALSGEHVPAREEALSGEHVPAREEALSEEHVPAREEALSGAPALSKVRACEIQEILDGLHLTGYFLDQWLLSPHAKKLPAARLRLTSSIRDLVRTKEPHGAEA